MSWRRMIFFSVLLEWGWVEDFVAEKKIEENFEELERKKFFKPGSIFSFFFCFLCFLVSLFFDVGPSIIITRIVCPLQWLKKHFQTKRTRNQNEKEKCILQSPHSNCVQCFSLCFLMFLISLKIWWRWRGLRKWWEILIKYEEGISFHWIWPDLVNFTWNEEHKFLWSFNQSRKLTTQKSSFDEEST